jgi:hypothetical protein
METSYKNKIRLVSDEQFGRYLNERYKLKITFQKGLLATIAISILIYLSKVL